MDYSKSIVLSGFSDEIDPDLDKQIELIRKLGMDHIEMRRVYGKELVKYSLDEIKEFKKKLDDGGIRLSSVGSPVGKIQITDEFEPHMELLRHTVEIAHLLGTNNIRMFSFFIPEDRKAEEFTGEVMERLGAFVDYAKKNDVVLLHENEKQIYGDVAVRCKEIMENFYGDHFKAVFDFANFVQCKQDTLEAYEMLKPYIDYIHVKDAKWEDGVVTPAGKGDGNVEQLLGTILKGGYKGYLSLEPHLYNFVGFAELEDGRSIGTQDRKLTGVEAFTLAHDALIQILNRI